MPLPQSIIAQTTDVHVVGHVLSPGGLFAAFLAALGLLPVVIGTFGAAAALTFYCFQIYDYPRVQKWLAQRHDRRRLKQVARLQYKQAVLIGELKRLGVLTHAEVTVRADHSQVSTVTMDPRTPELGPNDPATKMLDQLEQIKSSRED